MAGLALVVGASGIVGNNLARHLRARGWQVYGLARRPPNDIDGMLPVQADLLDPASLRTALQGLRPTHAFISAWLRQETEADNIRINGAMVRNVLDALAPAGSLEPRGAGDRAQALPRSVRGLRQRQAAGHAVSRGPAPARRRQLLLRAGRRAVRRRRACGLRMERAPAAYDHRLRGWQCHEHGRDARGLRHDLQGDRPAIPVSGIGDAVERTYRHDRCHAARPPPRMGGHDRSGARPGIQRRQRRRLPLELDVGTPGELVRAGAGAFPGEGRSRWSASWPTRDRSGPTSPANTPWRSPISPSSPRPGTPTPTWAARSRSSPT